jgi:hypothetical protein
MAPVVMAVEPPPVVWPEPVAVPVVADAPVPAPIAAVVADIVMPAPVAPAAVEAPPVLAEAPAPVAAPFVAPPAPVEPAPVELAPVVAAVAAVVGRSTRRSVAGRSACARTAWRAGAGRRARDAPVGVPSPQPCRLPRRSVAMRPAQPLRHADAGGLVPPASPRFDSHPHESSRYGALDTHPVLRPA